MSFRGPTALEDRVENAPSRWSNRLENEVFANKGFVERLPFQSTHFNFCVYDGAFPVFFTERRACLRLP